MNREWAEKFNHLFLSNYDQTLGSYRIKSHIGEQLPECDKKGNIFKAFYCPFCGYGYSGRFNNLYDRFYCENCHNEITDPHSD